MPVSDGRLDLVAEMCALINNDPDRFPMWKNILMAMTAPRSRDQDNRLYSMTVNGHAIYGHVTWNVIAQYWEAYANAGNEVVIKEVNNREE